MQVSTRAERRHCPPPCSRCCSFSTTGRLVLAVVHASRHYFETYPPNSKRLAWFPDSRIQTLEAPEYSQIVEQVGRWRGLGSHIWRRISPTCQSPVCVSLGPGDHGCIDAQPNAYDGSASIKEDTSMFPQCRYALQKKIEVCDPPMRCHVLLTEHVIQVHCPWLLG